MEKFIEFFEPWPIRLSGLIFTAAVGFGLYQVVPWSALTLSDWGTWIGSISTLIAVGVAGFAIYFQNKQALVAERKRRDSDEAMTLLSLKYLANEIRRMITLSGYQIDSVGNQIIYPDISAEFASICKMLEQLSVEHVASRGCIDEWHLLRRITTEMSILFRTAPEQGDGFYFRNRNRIETLHKLSSNSSKEIGEWLRELAPALYEKHKISLESL